MRKWTIRHSLCTKKSANTHSISYDGTQEEKKMKREKRREVEKAEKNNFKKDFEMCDEKCCTIERKEKKKRKIELSHIGHVKFGEVGENGFKEEKKRKEREVKERAQ